MPSTPVGGSAAPGRRATLERRPARPPPGPARTRPHRREWRPRTDTPSKGDVLGLPDRCNVARCPCCGYNPPPPVGRTARAAVVRITAHRRSGPFLPSVPCASTSSPPTSANPIVNPPSRCTRRDCRGSPTRDTGFASTRGRSSRSASTRRPGRGATTSRSQKTGSSIQAGTASAVPSSSWMMNRSPPRHRERRRIRPEELWNGWNRSQIVTGGEG